MSKSEIDNAKNLRNRNGAPKRLLFFSLEDWNHIWRRNQFICAELLKRHPELQILWVSPSIDIPFSICKGRFDQLQELHMAPRAVSDFDRALTIKPYKLLPGRVGSGFNHWTLRRHVDSTLRGLGWDSFDIWINSHGARNLLPFEGGQKVVYDITDDWSKLPHPAHQMRGIIEDDAALLRQADHVIVCSQSLYESKRTHCRKISLITNGVDSERYHPDALSKLKPPAELVKLTGPIVGYTGTLHSERLDIDLIDALADQLRSINFVFVGPKVLSPESVRRLNKPNVHVLGERSYSELPQYVSRFDVCMTPHMVDEFTESLDPLKLYEYMSTGKPIVSTRCAGFRELKDLIELAGRTDFAAAIQRALADRDDTKRDARLSWASNQSWGKRVDEVERVLGW